MSRRFLNIFNSQAPESQKLVISALMSLVLTYFFWPFVIPILIIAFIIKIFRIGKSKLQSFKESLGKINPGLINFFSKATTNIRDFDKDTGKVLKDINKLDKIINHPYIRKSLNSIEKYIETLNNIISQLLKETENKKLTQYKLTYYSSQFNATYKDAKIKIDELNRIINNMFSNPYLLRRLGNRIFRTNKFTPKYLMELRNITNDLTARLNNTYEKGQGIFEDLNKLLISSENISKKYENETDIILRKNLNNSVLLSLGKNRALVRRIQEIEKTIVSINRNPNIPPLKKAEILSEMDKSTKNLSKSLHKFKGNPKKISNFINKYYKKIINLIKH